MKQVRTFSLPSGKTMWRVVKGKNVGLEHVTAGTTALELAGWKA
jgi:hypothetical protein